MTRASATDGESAQPVDMALITAVMNESMANSMRQIIADTSNLIHSSVAPLLANPHLVCVHSKFSKIKFT